ncbi:MAG TPA: glycosyltransferase family 39 protein [Isosphaeraceae bacterium]|nr:glycosyltransferase family 39 protein [Isosphaeraceae bacterium]
MAPAQASPIDRTWKIAALATCAMVASQLLWLLAGCTWDLCSDEAFYWDWSRHLDWAYSTKGPMVAWVIRLATALTGGLATWLTGTAMPAVRLPAVVLGGLTAWAVFRLGSLTTKSERVGLWSLLLLPAVPLFATGGFVITDDGPFVCFWAWASVWTFRAIEKDRLRYWLIAGLMAFGGVLSKYTMVAFPVGVAVCLLAAQEKRGQLTRPGFWVMANLCLAGLVPIAIWNVRHDWVGMGHLAGRVGLIRSTWGGPETVFRFLVSEAAVLGGVWWLVGVLALVRAGRLLIKARTDVTCEQKPDSSADQAKRFGLWYLICLWAIVWLACLAASLRGMTQPNWGSPAYVSILVLIGWRFEVLLRLSSTADRRRFVWWRYAACWALMVLGMSVMRHSEWFFPLLAPRLPAPTAQYPAQIRRFDPTCRMRGYHGLAPEVERRVSALRAQGLDPFVLTPEYGVASSLSFYMNGQPDVYCLGGPAALRLAVGNQHDVWRPNPRFDPEHFQGRPAVIVEPTYLGIIFGQWITQLGLFGRAGATELVLVKDHGLDVAAWYVTICRDYRGVHTLEPMWQALNPLVTPEFFKAEGGTDRGFVRGVYRELLHRQPDPPEEEAWLAMIRMTSRPLTLVNIWTTDECRRLHPQPLYDARAPAVTRQERGERFSRRN